MTTMNNEDSVDPTVVAEPVAWAVMVRGRVQKLVVREDVADEVACKLREQDPRADAVPLYTADQMREAIAEERAMHPAPLATPSLTFTLREATELLAFFGESQTDVTVRLMPAGAVRDEDGSTYDSPAGLWAHCTEYPEEGLFYLGPVDSTEDYAPPAKLEPQRSNAARDVLAERRRQVEVEGYDTEHDDSHVNDEIAALACFYAMPPGAREWCTDSTGYGDTLGEAIIPENWEAREDDRRRELVKAGALVLAEIERLDRAAEKEQPK